MRRGHHDRLPNRRWLLIRWLVHRVYAARGRRDGRRGLPAVSSDGATPTPTLYHLADEMGWEADLLVAQAVSDATATRVALAKLTVAGGQIDRERDRLQLLIERRAAVLSDELTGERRLGEEDLPDCVVVLRRQRERHKRLRRAEKRLEDQRTALAQLVAHEEALRTQLSESARHLEAQIRLVGAERRAEASSYLNGALRTHRQRTLLMPVLPDLLPSVPTGTLRQGFEMAP